MLSRRQTALFLAPAGLLLAVFLVVPAVWSLGQSFSNFTLLGPDAQHPRFTGLRNYLLALQDPYFWSALKVSLVYVVGSALVGQCGLGLLLALFTSRVEGWLASLVRGLAVLAWITPGVVVAILWNVLLHGDGTLNGLLGTRVNWLSEHPWLCIVVFNTWRGTAFSMLLFDAALRSIPDSYYEAASVSGASHWRQFWDITLPLVRPQLLTDLLLVTMWTFNDFGPYLLTAGGPSFQTEVLPIYTYRVAFRDFDLGYGAALSTVLLLLNLAMALAYQRLLKR
ncbi:MAG: sugar ABC transporter permease [Candidatus Eremiobacterota bacterium]